jgi:hypothetical protein
VTKQCRNAVHTSDAKGTNTSATQVGVVVVVVVVVGVVAGVAASVE